MALFFSGYHNTNHNILKYCIALEVMMETKQIPKCCNTAHRNTLYGCRGGDGTK